MANSLREKIKKLWYDGKFEEIIDIAYREGYQNGIDDFSAIIIDYVTTHGTIPNHFSTKKLADMLKECVQNDD